MGMEIKKSHTLMNARFFNVDPTGFTPVSPVVKNGILLHKLQARVHDKNAKTKEVLLQGLPLLTTGGL